VVGRFDFDLLEKSPTFVTQRNYEFPEYLADFMLWLGSDLPKINLEEPFGRRKARRKDAQKTQPRDRSASRADHASVLIKALNFARPLAVVSSPASAFDPFFATARESSVFKITPSVTAAMPRIGEEWIVHGSTG
jgi:hypothetical protein